MSTKYKQPPKPFAEESSWPDPLDSLIITMLDHQKEIDDQRFQEWLGNHPTPKNRKQRRALETLQRQEKKPWTKRRS